MHVRLLHTRKVVCLLVYGVSWYVQVTLHIFDAILLALQMAQ